ncbi:hypothetical protein [Pseudoclavibacter sp. RFBG4]|nr:hypothetical protein [Pseudoclavibacter sp. RFBG4]
MPRSTQASYFGCAAPDEDLPVSLCTVLENLEEQLLLGSEAVQ